MLRASLPLGISVGALSRAAASVTTLGQEFLPRLDEGDILIELRRPAGTSIEQAQAMHLQVEKVIAKAPEVRTVFSRTGTAELASDPMPPNATDTFIMLKPRKEWPDPSLPKAELVERLERALAVLPGHEYAFSQPIQMRLDRKSTRLNSSH